MRGNSPLAKLEQEAWLQQWLPQLRAELEALQPRDLIPINVDVPSTICTVYGVLPKLQQLRERIADELPRFDLAAFDRLELYAHALFQAQTHYIIASNPPDHLDELVARATTLRAHLLAEAHCLALRRLLPAEALKNLKTQSGIKPLAMDLEALSRLFRSHWPALIGKCPTPESDVTESATLSVTLLTIVGRRQFTHALAVASQLRLRTFTLLARTYDDARRAVIYLCGRQTDPNTIAPSLYGGRKRRKRADAGQPPLPAPNTDDGGS